MLLSETSLVKYFLQFEYKYHGTNLVVVEDRVSERVLPWNCVGPQLLHEEYLIGQRWNDSCKKEYQLD